jgi:DNA-directed RNA polymerase subunit RPC12/RpoP
MFTKCSKCGYEWNYRGKSFKATCPNCGTKVVVTPRGEKKARKRSTISDDVEKAKAIIKESGWITEPQLFLKLQVGINKFYWIKKILEQDPELQIEDGFFAVKGKAPQKKLTEAV